MKVKFWIGVDSASAIDAELDSVFEVAEWIEEHELFIPRYLTIATLDGYGLYIINLHNIPYRPGRDSTFKIIMNGISNAIEENPILAGIEIKF